jgi:hypothetical protein
MEISPATWDETVIQHLSAETPAGMVPVRQAAHEPDVVWRASENEG